VKVKASDTDYTLGILIDDDHHYSNLDMLEQYYQRPEVLQSFGWRIIQVYSKDWLSQKDRVVKQILRKITDEPEIISPSKEEETMLVSAHDQDEASEEVEVEQENKQSFIGRYDH